MFNVQPELGFNVSPAITPGFRVGLPEDLPGFRIDKNGSVRRMFGGSSNVPAFDYDPYGNTRLTTSLPTGFSYPGNASSGHYLLAFDPVGSRWSSRDTFGENTDVTKSVLVRRYRWRRPLPQKSWKLPFLWGRRSTTLIH
jgi:hypothetical protein